MRRTNGLKGIICSDCLLEITSQTHLKALFHTQALSPPQPTSKCIFIQHDAPVSNASYLILTDSPALRKNRSPCLPEYIHKSLRVAG